jgi:hypothetical protein
MMRTTFPRLASTRLAAAAVVALLAGGDGAIGSRPAMERSLADRGTVPKREPEPELIVDTGEPSPLDLGKEAARCASPPPGAAWLPAACTRGPIQYLRQYPAVSIATRSQRRAARRLLEQVVEAADEEGWRNLRAVALAGYNTRIEPRRAGDRSVRYFHAERDPEPRPDGVQYVRRPKALIFANAPGRPLVLVGAMWSTRPNERGPTPGGPITRWHTHLGCADSRHRVIEPTVNGMCPRGTHLHHGRVEMMHVWFTRDLRSMFAIRAPEPELCVGGLLPRHHCRRSVANGG